VAGRAVDGYLAGCEVFVDLDGDGTAGWNEPTAVTDRLGGFVLPQTNAWTNRRGQIAVSMSTPGCVDTFTNAAPGMLHLSSAEPVGPDATFANVMVTPLTTVAAALARNAGVDPGDAKAIVVTALGLDSSIDIARVDPLALASTGGGAELVVATSSVANLVSTLSALLTHACGGDAAKAERFVVNAVADKMYSSAGGSSGVTDGKRRRLRETSHVDLGSAATVSALAVDSIDGAVAGGAIAPSTIVSADAIAAVAEVSSGSARVLKQIAIDSGDTDPMAVVRSAASVTAVMQGPGVKGAITEVASVGSDPQNCAGFATLTELKEPARMISAVNVAERSLPAIEVAQAPPPPPPPTPPNAPGVSTVAAASEAPLHVDLGDDDEAVSAAKTAPSFGVVVGVVVGAVVFVSCASAMCRGRRGGSQGYEVDAKGRRVIGRRDAGAPVVFTPAFRAEPFGVSGWSTS
jgi:hypothetical protein